MPKIKVNLGQLPGAQDIIEAALEQPYETFVVCGLITCPQIVVNTHSGLRDPVFECTSLELIKDRNWSSRIVNLIAQCAAQRENITNSQLNNSHSDGGE